MTTTKFEEMTLAEIATAIQEAAAEVISKGSYQYEADWYSVAECAWSKDTQRLFHPGMPPIDIVDEYTGAEGGQEATYMIFNIGDRFFRIDGYYMSYSGTEWDGDFYEVKPEVRSVTFYEEKVT